MAKVGRPTKFSDRVGEKILELYRQGKTDQQVADFIGIHVRTLENWKYNDQEFLWATKEAKEIADDLVEASLLARALGYSHPEEKVFQYEGQIITHESQKHYPPDVKAQEIWLRNRRPKDWRDEKTIKHEGGDKPIEIQPFDIEARIKQLKAEQDEAESGTD